MGKIVVNVANGQSDYYGTLKPFSDFMNGQVIKGLNVTQNGTVNMTVLVQPGSGQILEGTGAAQFGRFIATDSTTSVTITTSNGSNPRIDTIVAYFKTGTAPVGVNNPNMLEFAAVAGTPAGSPSAPSGATIQTAIGAGKPYVILANVLVGTAVTTITDSNVTDRRTFIAPQGTSGYTSLGATPTATANGQKSYDLTFTGSDHTSTLSEGMRLLLERTVAAPIQSTKLNGTTQYWSKSSPAGMTFTDDFSVSAWVKLDKYQASAIISRADATPTNGWFFTVDSSGLIGLQGRNAGAYRLVQSYQSVPLNKWIHLVATLDMSANVGKIYIDGVLVPSSMTGGATSLVQAGNLEVGSRAGATVFSGSIAQAGVFSSILSLATIQGMMNQSLTGSETSLISAYKFDGNGNSIGTSNNLTANGSVVATSADAPFGNSGVSTTKEYAIVMTKPVFSAGNTTMTVQVPEGCALPTTGGIASVSYSSASVPFGFPRDEVKWIILASLGTIVSGTTGAPNSPALFSVKAPVGSWKAKGSLGWQVAGEEIQMGLSTSSTSYSNKKPVTRDLLAGSGTRLNKTIVEDNFTFTAQTSIYAVGASANVWDLRGDMGSPQTSEIVIENAYL